MVDVDGPVSWLSAAAVLVPFLVAAGWALLSDQGLLLGGDQGLIGLDTDDAAGLSQAVGPYSRYGWAHPGPLWFYLLAPVHWLGGSDSAALIASVTVVNGLAAAAVVVILGRRRSRWVALAGAAVLAVFLLRMPAYFFVQVWNPFALVLPGILLVLLAAESVRRPNLAHLLGTAVVASFLVQTHIGTLPLVGAVGVVAVLGSGWRRRRADPVVAHGGRNLLLGAVLVAVWIPPVVQQLAAAPGQGNLGRLLTFFLTDPPDAGAPHSLAESVTAVGRLLALAPLGRGPGPLEMDVSALSATVATVLVIQVLAAVALVVAGVARRRTAAGLVGGFVLVALAAGVLSARTATGPLYWYLLVWVSALPATTLLGAALLFGDPLPRRVRPARPVRVVGGLLASGGPVVAGGVLVVVLCAVAAVSLARAAVAMPGSYGTRAVLDVAEPALVGGTIVLDVRSHELWPIASGVGYALTQDSDRVLINPGITDLFGEDRAAPETAGPRLMLAAADVPAPAGGRLLGVVATEVEPTAVYLIG